jgi:hypothetical protein
MRKLLIVFAALLLAGQSYSQRAEHVVLITVDGFRPQLYLDPSFQMANVIS